MSRDITELAAQLGSAPVQYGSIKALALAEAGRFDEVDAALAQEVTDDEHPFGRACAENARTFYLTIIDALDQAGGVGVDAHRRAVELSRVWMRHMLISNLTSVRARLTERGLVVPEAIDATIDGSDIAPSKVARAEALLRAGRSETAAELLQSLVVDLAEAGQVRELGAALLLLAQAHLALGDPNSALVVCDAALATAVPCGHHAIIWKLQMVNALASDANGDSASAAEQRAAATAEFEMLRDRIADVALRRCFETQPLAPA